MTKIELVPVSMKVGFAVATVGAGALVSEVYATQGEADGFAKRLGRCCYVVVEVRS